MARLPLTLALTGLSAAMAFQLQAQDEIEVPAVSGTVQFFDRESRTIVFEDGTRYTLGENSDVGTLQEGSEVTLSCDATDTNCAVVTSETPESEGTAPD